MILSLLPAGAARRERAVRPAGRASEPVRRHGAARDGWTGSWGFTQRRKEAPALLVMPDLIRHPPFLHRRRQIWVHTKPTKGTKGPGGTKGSAI